MSERMSKNHVSWCLLLTIYGVVVIGCATGQQKNRNPAESATAAQSSSNVNEERLSQLVRTFSEDQGEIGNEAWRNLQTTPKTDLVQSLDKLNQGLPSKDPLRPKIAFVLCNLDHDYSRNTQVIESALAKSSPFDRFYADDAEVLLSRLIQRGDKTLLKELFLSANWSDASLAEGLGDTFTRELEQDPEQFLLQLKEVPQQTRHEVYALIEYSDSLTRDQVISLKARLSSIPRDSPIAETAREVLNTSVFKTR
jgi:hypothetical protein